MKADGLDVQEAIEGLKWAEHVLGKIPNGVPDETCADEVTRLREERDAAVASAQGWYEKYWQTLDERHRLVKQVEALNDQLSDKQEQTKSQAHIIGRYQGENADLLGYKELYEEYHSYYLQSLDTNVELKSQIDDLENENKYLCDLLDSEAEARADAFEQLRSLKSAVRGLVKG